METRRSIYFCDMGSELDEVGLAASVMIACSKWYNSRTVREFVISCEPSALVARALT
jgi:hypothetical protein